jgi:outer membrane murein-binding lipoprotein Lpp
MRLLENHPIKFSVAVFIAITISVFGLGRAVESYASSTNQNTKKINKVAKEISELNKNLGRIETDIKWIIEAIKKEKNGGTFN